MSAASDPKRTGQLPVPPMLYKLFIWRKIMNITYEDMLHTPASVIYSDLEMISLEKQFNVNPESKL